MFFIVSVFIGNILLRYDVFESINEFISATLPYSDSILGVNF